MNGSGDNSRYYVKILSGVTKITSYQVIAETDLIYTGNGGSTFISLVYDNINDDIDEKSPISHIYGDTTG